MEKTDGLKKKPFVGQAARRLVKLRALLHAAVHQFADLSELLLRVDRADVGVLVQRIADAQDLDAVLQLREHGFRHAFLHEQPRAGAAHMALVEKDAVHDAFHGLVERRVVEDDVRRLAAEFHRHLLVRARERAHDDLADLRAARERDLRGERMIHHRRAGFAGAADDVHHARRQSGLLQDLAELQRGDARGLRGLDHDAVSHRQRGRDLPRHHQQRKIPRDDLADHADAASRARPGATYSSLSAQPA